MRFINKYLRNIIPYRVASHKIWTVDDKDRAAILKLDWNESTIPPSPKVNERIQRLVNGPCFYQFYPSTYNEELLNLLSKYIDIPMECIQYFSSSDSLHEYIARTFVTTGDPVLLIGPTYDNFRLTAEASGATLYRCDFGHDDGVSVSGIQEAIYKYIPSLVYICNPNNPTGSVLDVCDIEELIKRNKNTLFLIDEAYMEFADKSAAKLVVNNDNILISRTMSKAFGLANFRFGYLLANKQNIEDISKIRNPKNIPTFTQEAVIGALEDIEYMERYVEEITKAKDIVYNYMGKYSHVFEVYPSAANFVMIRFYDEHIRKNFVDSLTFENIFIRDICQNEYIAKYCVRITIGTRDQMKHVFAAIDDFMESKGLLNG